MRRLPAETCCLCDQPLEAFEGVRIIARSHVGLAFFTADTPLRDLHTPCRVEPLGSGLYLVLWGNVWTGEAVQRAVTSAADRHRPWFHERCAGLSGRTGADWLHDDGSVTHAPVWIDPSRTDGGKS